MSKTEKIRSFIIDNYLFGDDRGLKDDSSFLGEGILDSTGIMHLVAFLGEEFSIVIDDDELFPENLDSINKITAFIERKNSSVPFALNILASCSGV